MASVGYHWAVHLASFA